MARYQTAEERIELTEMRLAEMAEYDAAPVGPHGSGTCECYEKGYRFSPAYGSRCYQGEGWEQAWAQREREDATAGLDCIPDYYAEVESADDGYEGWMSADPTPYETATALGYCDDEIPF